MSSPVRQHRRHAQPRLEGGASWSAPGQWVSLESAFTWQDLRTSSDGPFAAMNGVTAQL